MAKKRISRFLVLATMLVAIALLINLPGVAHADYLATNLYQTVDPYSSVPGWGYIAGYHDGLHGQLANKFSTGGDSYNLTSVFLMLQQVSSGSAQVAIYTNNPDISDPHFVGAPGTQVGSNLNSPSSYPTTGFGFAHFTSSGISLDASTVYWIVLSGLGVGQFYWALPTDPNGMGDGYLADAAYTQPSGNWYSPVWGPSDPPPFMPFMYQVGGQNPVPAPATLLLFGSGLLGLVGLKWKLRKP